MYCLNITTSDSAQPTAGTSYELDAIAAVVLGGTSLSGGRGWIVGTFIGVLIIGVLNNGLNLLRCIFFLPTSCKRAVILLAVLIDRRKRSVMEGQFMKKWLLILVACYNGHYCWLFNGTTRMGKGF